MAKSAWTKGRRAPRQRQRAAPGPDHAGRAVGHPDARIDRELRPANPWLAWTSWLLTRLVVPVLLLAAIGASVLYVRLLNGAISLKSLAQPIARAIEADLEGFGVKVEDAAVLLTDQHTLEFRLRNVRLADREGAPVALAPLAAVTLSTNAMWSGRIAPERVVLIEPRLLLLYSREQGLALSFARPPEAPAPAGTTQAPTNVAGNLRPSLDTASAEYAAGTAGKAIDMGRTLASLAIRHNAEATTASFLKQIGLRNATLIFDNAGQQSMWRIAEGELGINHRRQGSVVGGNVALATTAGRWQLTFEAHENKSSSTIGVDIDITNLVPGSIAHTLPMLAPLAALDLPVDGKVQLELSPEGGLNTAMATLDGRRGSIDAGWQGGGGRLPFDGGKVVMRYGRDTGVIEVLPSALTSGSNRVTLGGRIGLPRRPGQPWPFELTARDGVLGGEAGGLAPAAIETLRLRGRLSPDAGVVLLDEARLKAGGGEIAATGTIAARGAAARTEISGQLSAMPVSSLLRMWPSVIAPAARRWSIAHFEGGRLAGGRFTIVDRATRTGGTTGPIRSAQAQGTPMTQGGQGQQMHMSMSLVGENVQLRAVAAGIGAMAAPRALLRLQGGELEVTAPDAVVISPANRRLPLKSVRLLSTDAYAPTATGTLTLKAQGTLPALIDLLPRQSRDGRSLELPGKGIDGKIEANLKLIVPLGEDSEGMGVRLTGSGRVTDGKARGVIGSYDMNGAGIQFDVTEQALTASGEMLVGGVATKLSFGRIFAAPDDDQPPLIVRATLDAADRAQLKLDINDLVIGDVPVELRAKAAAHGASAVEVRADLTNVEMVLESLAWKKPAGRRAVLTFDAKDSGRGGTELANFKLAGDDIALNGSMALDKSGRVVAFKFPEFSLNVISQLQAEGHLRQDRIWDVKVRGQTYDGREFFRTLFSVGQIRDAPLPASATRIGLDLDAQIANVLGYHELSLKELRMRMSKRNGLLTGLKASGLVSGGGGAGVPQAKPLQVEVVTGGDDRGEKSKGRRLVARSDDAGQVFRLVGFYPSMQGGQMQLDVNLDGRGAAEKTGLLVVRRFNVLGDPVAYEPGIGDEQAPGRRPTQTMQRPVLPFDSMRAPFSVGYGQFVIEDADLRGPVLGVVLKGKADFRARQVDLGGTYVPLQGLNSAIGNFPILGQLLAGPRGEGVLGMTFAIQGAMAKPQVLINPVSIGLPGILREMMQMTNPTPRVTPRSPESGTAPPKRTAPAVRSSPRAIGNRQPAAPRAKVDPEGGWSSKTVPRANQ